MGNPGVKFLSQQHFKRNFCHFSGEIFWKIYRVSENSLLKNSFAIVHQPILLHCGFSVYYQTSPVPDALRRIDASRKDKKYTGVFKSSGSNIYTSINIINFP